MERDLWGEVERTLDEFVAYYERTNLATTFGLLPLWRREASQNASHDQAALEIGPATGGFSRLLPCRRVYLLEPSAALARFVRGRLAPTRYVVLRGVAEAIPLKSSLVDRVFCSFSFRDFLDKEEAVREIIRVLRPGGEVHVVDVTRPARGWRRTLLDLWIGRGAAALTGMMIPARVRAGWRENPYACLFRTYTASPSLPTIVSIFKARGFQAVGAKTLGLQGPFHLWGVKPSTT